MNFKNLQLPALSRASQALVVVRDLLGAAALGATLALSVFVGWLVVQFGHAPTLEQLADAGQTLTWIIAGVYGAIWLVRALNPTSTSAASGRARKLNLSPLVRASGNAVLATIAACALATATHGAVDPPWVVVVGYPIATLLALLISAMRPAREP